MRLLGSVPVLACSDVERSLEFYQQALQFIVIKKRVGDQGVEWAYLQSGDTLLMLEQDTQQREQQAITRNRLYLYCDDVAAMHHFLVAKAYQASAIVRTDYMEEFDLIDPDGQRLTIGRQIT